MKKTHSARRSLWVWNNIVPYRLAGRELALALLIHEQPLTLPQLCSRLTDAGYKAEHRNLIRSLARLTSRGVISENSGVYTCKADIFPDFAAEYTQSQLLDLIGLTQSTVGGRAFYTAAPPISSSSNGGRLCG